MVAEVGEGVHCEGWTLRCPDRCCVGVGIAAGALRRSVSICRETRAPGVSVAQVARRHALNANLIFKWLKDRRFAPADAVEAAPDGVGLISPARPFPGA
jgi:Transposase